MAYRIAGLSPDDFTALTLLDDVALAMRRARRVTATDKPGFPCRITLQDAEVGETLFLLNHVSHDVATPFRSAYAIYVREGATEATEMVDALPQVFEGRSLGLRAFDAEGMLRSAALALPGEADAKIRMLFDAPEIAYIHAHNAAHGCFAARVDRA